MSTNVRDGLKLAHRALFWTACLNALCFLISLTSCIFDQWCEHAMRVELREAWFMNLALAALLWPKEGRS